MKKIHRFYVGDHISLGHDFWVHDHLLLERWRSLGLQQDDEVVLFDGVREDRLYRIVGIDNTEAHLHYITDYARNLPRRDVIIVWPLRSNADIEEVVRVGVECGASHFLPYYEDRDTLNRSQFDLSELRMLAVQQVEEGERSDIPVIREPMTIDAVVEELRDKTQFIVCEFATELGTLELEVNQPVAFFIPDKSGWSEREKSLFTVGRVRHLDIGENVHDLPEIIETVLTIPAVVSTKQ